jgi:hypothetical protein
MAKKTKGYLIGYVKVEVRLLLSFVELPAGVQQSKVR